MRKGRPLLISGFATLAATLLLPYGTSAKERVSALGWANNLAVATGRESADHGLSLHAR